MVKVVQGIITEGLTAVIHSSSGITSVGTYSFFRAAEDLYVPTSARILLEVSPNQFSVDSFFTALKLILGANFERLPIVDRFMVTTKNQESFL